MLELNNEHNTAFCNILDAFNNACSARSGQIHYELISSRSNYQNLLAESNRKNNSEKAVDSYKNLFKALNQPDITLTKEAVEIRSHLEDSLKTGEFSKVENFIDQRTKSLFNPGNNEFVSILPDIALVRVTEIRRNNPRLHIAARLNDFGKNVLNAARNLTIGKGQ